MVLSKLVVAVLMTASIPTHLSAQTAQTYDQCSMEAGFVQDQAHEASNKGHFDKYIELDRRWRNMQLACNKLPDSPENSNNIIDGANPYKDMSQDEMRAQIESRSILAKAHEIIAHAEAQQYIRSSER